jgi:hypothetical protein
MAERFDTFSEDARRVLQLAQEEAQRFNHSYIGTEHLLLGLVGQGGLSGRVLTNLGIQLADVRHTVESIIGRGVQPVTALIGLTPRAKRVIEYSVEEARRLGHKYIGTEHLLLGLVREGEGIAAGVLESLGIDLVAVRAETVRLIDNPEAPAVGEPPVEFDVEALTASLAPGEDAIQTILSHPRFDCRVIRLDPSSPVHEWLAPPGPRSSLIVILSGQGELQTASEARRLAPSRFWVLPTGSFDRVVATVGPLVILCIELR